MLGSPGEKGSPGELGFADFGAKGRAGNPGIQGHPGLPGLQGPPGLRGDNGISGNDGIKGKVFRITKQRCHRVSCFRSITKCVVKVCLDILDKMAVMAIQGRLVLQGPLDRKAK